MGKVIKMEIQERVEERRTLLEATEKWRNTITGNGQRCEGLAKIVTEGRGEGYLSTLQDVYQDRPRKQYTFKIILKLYVQSYLDPN